MGSDRAARASLRATYSRQGRARGTEAGCCCEQQPAAADSELHNDPPLRVNGEIPPWSRPAGSLVIGCVCLCCLQSMSFLQHPFGFRRRIASGLPKAMFGLVDQLIERPELGVRVLVGLLRSPCGPGLEEPD